jgi:PAS domain-containing protein
VFPNWCNFSAKLFLLRGENFKHRLSAQPSEIAWQDAELQISIPVGFLPACHSCTVMVTCSVAWPWSVTVPAPLGSLRDLAEALSSELDVHAQDAIWRDGRVPSGAEANLLGIIESSNEAIMSETLDGTVKSWNGAAERLLGYSAKQVIGRNIMFIIPGGNEVNVRTQLAPLESDREQHVMDLFLLRESV